MQRNKKIKFLICTACSTAGSNGKLKNTATVLSEKISKKGIVIANQYTVSGRSSSFWGVIDGENPVKGWKAYRNGKVITTDIPAELTFDLAAEIYNELK